MQRPLFRFPPAHSLLRVLKMMSIFITEIATDDGHNIAAQGFYHSCDYICWERCDSRRVRQVRHYSNSNRQRWRQLVWSRITALFPLSYRWALSTHWLRSPADRKRAWLFAVGGVLIVSLECSLHLLHSCEEEKDWRTVSVHLIFDIHSPIPAGSAGDCWPPTKAHTAACGFCWK